MVERYRPADHQNGAARYRMSDKQIETSDAYHAAQTFKQDAAFRERMFVALSAGEERIPNQYDYVDNDRHQ